MPSQDTPPSPLVRLGFVLALALLFTLLNAVKPLHVDDTAYHFYAAHLAREPLSPYGFSVFWYDVPQPANEVLAPVALPYWWSAAIRLFGERPCLWKLWLLPFALLLVGSLHWLARRFCRGLELPLVAMTVLSPTLLPSFNLMLDVPALALSLTAVALFLHACDRGSLGWAALAGLVAGLAAQTKYTGLVTPAVILLTAYLRRRPAAGLLAAMLAGGVFASWEIVLWRLQGESHFLHHLGGRHESLSHKLALVSPLASLLGGLLPALTLIGLIGLGWQRRMVLAAGLLLVLGFVALACVPESWGTLVRNPKTMEDALSVGHLIFGASGVALFAVVSILTFRKMDTEGWFLLCWLALEVTGYVGLTPFPAVRRVMGVSVVLTLLVGSLVYRACAESGRAVLIRWAAAGGVLLGLLVWAVDWQAAWAERQVTREAVRWLHRQPPGGVVWYIGHWGFQYHAERAGMKPLRAGPGQLHNGDWIVTRHEMFKQNRRVISVAELTANGLLPLRTVPCYYMGRTPLEHRDGPCFRLWIYHVVPGDTPAK